MKNEKPRYISVTVESIKLLNDKLERKDTELSDLQSENLELKSRVPFYKYGSEEIHFLQCEGCAKTKEELSNLRTELSDYKDCYNATKSGLRADEKHCACAYELNKEIAILRTFHAALIEVMERVDDLLDIVVVDPSKSLKTHTGVECQRQLREALSKAHRVNGGVKS